MDTVVSNSANGEVWVIMAIINPVKTAEVGHSRVGFNFPLTTHPKSARTLPLQIDYPPLATVRRSCRNDPNILSAMAGHLYSTPAPCNIKASRPSEFCCARTKQTINAEAKSLDLTQIHY